MPITRRFFLAGAALSAGAIGLPSLAAADRPIRFMADTPNLYRDIFDIAFNELGRADQGYSVDMIWTQDYTQTLQQSLRDGLIGQGPDVALHAHNNVAMLARRRAIVPIDAMLADETRHLRSPVGQVGEALYAVPLTASVPVVYLNRDLAGRMDVLPSTWEEILSLASRIDAPSGGAFFNYATDGSWTFMALIESLGGRIVNEAGTSVAFDSAAGLEAMEILGGFAGVRKGQTLTASQARQAFASGALGIHIDTTSRLRFFEEQAKGKFALEVLPFPVKNTPDARIPPSGGSLTIMAKNGPRQTDAWSLIKALQAPSVQEKIFEKTGFIPGLAAFGDKADIPLALQSSPYYHAIAPTLAVLGPWPSFPVENPARVDRAVQDALTTLASLQATPAQTLDRILIAARET